MSRKGVLVRGGFVGGITSLGLVGLFSLGKQIAGLPFLPFDIFDWMARVLPGPLVTFVIDTIVRLIGILHLGPTASTAKLAEQTIATTQFILLGIVLGLLLGLILLRRPAQANLASQGAGILLALLAILVEAILGFPGAGAPADILWSVLLMGGWGWVLNRWVDTELALSPAPTRVDGLSRRAFLLKTAGAGLGFVLASIGLERLSMRRAIPVTANPQNSDFLATAVAHTSGPAASPGLDALRKRLPFAPGTRAEVTPTEQFYRVDINTSVPNVDSPSWHLQLDGLIDHPLALTLADLRKYPAVSQVITLECISNAVGGDLISTGEWMGVPLKTILAEAGLKPQAAFLNITAQDGFYELLGMTEAMDDRTLLVYGMNGGPLPPEHGFPLRIYIPNHYGMKQPKWIEHIEVSDTDQSGYWVDRGWSKTAFVQTTSVIDNVAVGDLDTQKQTVPVGGIAFAGARGISKVEIQVDEGGWTEAVLIIPPVSPLTWVAWRYEYPYQKGRHVFRVRAYDGNGQLQTAENNPQIPNGATGIFTYAAIL